MSTDLKSIRKFFTDILLMLGLLGCGISTTVFDASEEKLKEGAKLADVFSWDSIHCILSTLFICMILIHFWQHRVYLKLLVTKKLFIKNKIISLAALVFIITAISCLFYLTGFSSATIQFHTSVAPVLLALIILHLISKIKRFLGLIQTRKAL